VLQGFNKKTIITIFIQLVLVVGSCIAAYHLTRHFNIIPKSILHLPEVYVSQSDLWNIVTIFVITFLIQIVSVVWYFGNGAFTNTARFSNEYVCYLFSYTTASLYLFLATTINYDPQLIAGFGLISTFAYLIAYAVSQTFASKNLFVALWECIKGLLSRMVSISGALAIGYFLVPLALGKAFTSDRDVANVITQVRIFFNPVETSIWGFKNKFPGVVFEQPVLVKQAPNEDNFLYVVERAGRLYKINQAKGSKPELVLDIRDSLGEVEVENGAVGLAFHPKFGAPVAGNHFIYLYYTDTRPNNSQLNKLSRFDIGLADMDAVMASEMTILELERTADGFHNGGGLEFGPDGYLYIGLGEGVHPKNVKNYDEVLRSGILRIDIDMNIGTSSAPNIDFKHGKAENYLVPNDNPFVNNPNVMDEYWALGLRNPFRFSFDSVTGKLWLGDVGSTIWEEVNLIEKGKHYQFPAIEGRKPTGKKEKQIAGVMMQGPVYTYEHNAYDRAVIGGVVNRGDKYPEIGERYVFADNYSAKLFVMDIGIEQVEKVELIARANQYAQRGISSVTQIRSGEILVTTLGAASEASGEVLELVKSGDADVVVEKEEDATPQGYDDKATASLFAVNCGRCHGEIGDGNGPDSGMLDVKVPDFTSPLYKNSRSSDDIKAIIEKGGAPLGKSPMMPPWGGFLKPHEIEHLAIYIESLPDKHHQNE
jgi:glucose/arabinose dehydrogenase/mono/diheme cytochrome c family protein